MIVAEQYFFSDSNLYFKVAAGQLIVSYQISERLENKIEGLLGNYNGDKKDDMIPRGSNTPLSTSATPQEIFEFGKTC